MIANIETLGTVVGVLGGICGLVMLAGLLAGQFRRGVVEELRGNLASAASELAINRTTIERLEVALDSLKREVETLRGENEFLRAMVKGPDAPQMKELLGRFDRLEKLVARNYAEGNGHGEAGE